MNAFALACSGLCGGFGASGLYRAARACVWPTMEAKASEPIPQKQSVRISRRLRAYRICSGISVHVQKSVQVEDGQGELFHLGGIVGPRRQERHREILLGRGGPASGGQSKRV